MYRIRIIQKKGNQNRSGQAPIYVEYAFNRDKKALFNTGKKVASEHWNIGKREIKKSHPDHAHLNSFIKGLARDIELIADRAIQNDDVPTANYIKEHLGKSARQVFNREKDLDEIMDEWIDSSKAKSARTTLKGYNSFKNHFLNYLIKRKKRFTISDLSPAIYDDFLLYLETEVKLSTGEVGLLESAAGKQIKNLKVFLKYCFKKELIKEFDLSDFKVKSGTTDHVYVNDYELDKIQAVEFPDAPHLAKTRDLFVVGCETGLRYSDLSALRLDHIQEGFIRKPVKKSTRKVIIPVSKRLQGVLDKYPDGLPKAVHNAVFNRQVKEVCKAAGIDTPFSRIIKRGNIKEEITVPKYEAISSHTCRRSFCTNQFLKGMPTLLIRKISGHKTEKAFLQYIKIDEEQAAEEMARRWVEFASSTHNNS